MAFIHCEITSHALADASVLTGNDSESTIRFPLPRTDATGCFVSAGARPPLFNVVHRILPIRPFATRTIYSSVVFCVGCVDHSLLYFVGGGWVWTSQNPTAFSSGWPVAPTERAAMLKMKSNAWFVAAPRIHRKDTFWPPSIADCTINRSH